MPGATGAISGLPQTSEMPSRVFSKHRNWLAAAAAAAVQLIHQVAFYPFGSEVSGASPRFFRTRRENQGRDGVERLLKGKVMENREMKWDYGQV